MSMSFIINMFTSKQLYSYKRNNSTYQFYEND